MRHIHVLDVMTNLDLHDSKRRTSETKGADPTLHCTASIAEAFDSLQSMHRFGLFFSENGTVTYLAERRGYVCEGVDRFLQSRKQRQETKKGKHKTQANINIQYSVHCILTCRKERIRL